MRGLSFLWEFNIIENSVEVNRVHLNWDLSVVRSPTLELGIWA